MVADLFTIISNEKINSQYKLTPTVQSLKGIIRGKKIVGNDYDEYLEKNIYENSI